MYRKIVCGIIIFFSITIVFISCNQKKTFYRPGAIEGVLDLRNWDESSNQVISLDGDWEFYWNQLIEPSQFTKKITAPVFIKVPGAWNKQGKYGNSFPSLGYGTYRLRILHNPQYVGQIKTIHMPFVHTAYTLWINGKVICRNGIVGTSNSTMVPFQLPIITEFVIDKPMTEIVLHISNFQQRDGGILHSIKYGNFEIISKQNELNIFVTLCVAAAILIIFFYHLGLYYVNKEYRPNMYFALFCIAIALRMTLTSSKIFVKYFPYFSWDVYLRIEYCSMLCAMIFFSHFMDELFPNKINKIVLRLIDYYFTFFIIFVIISPILYASQYVIFMNLGLLIAGFYLLFFIIVRESSYKSVNSIIYVGGALLLFITMLNDILYVQGIINSFYIFEVGLLFFIFSQSLVAFEESIKIQNLLFKIDSELDIARRIQNTILPETTPATNSMYIEICYMPMEKVGGDFYHFCELDVNKIGVLIADVTGHGIPASLLASTVNIAFSLQKDIADKPDRLLLNINNVLYKKTGDQPITALYAYIDTTQMIVKFARAGHPYPLILQSKNHKVVEINVPGKVLGVFKTIKTDTVEFPIKKGDKIILYTDGITDNRNYKGEIFGIERFVECIEKNYHKNPRGMIASIVDAAIQWAGRKEMIEDDITIIIIEIT